MKIKSVRLKISPNLEINLPTCLFKKKPSVPLRLGGSRPNFFNPEAGSILSTAIEEKKYGLDTGFTGKV
jgi:hypothetical protein